MNMRIATKHLISAWTNGTRRLVLGLGLLAISLAALLPAAVSFATTPVSFSPATSFLVEGTHPASVAIADLNGDGKPDLAAANVFSDNVSILLGTGTGTFGAATTFAVGPHPTSVAIADLNGDGKPDLAVANFHGGSVSILLGTGTGAFGAATNFPAGGNPFSVAIGDLNGDGKPDLAVTLVNVLDAVSVLLGTGTGGFGAATIFVAGGTPESVAIGDLNGDGKPDLAVANFYTNNVSVLLNTTPPAGATPSFSAANFAGGTGPISVAIADLNGDSKPDLAVANHVSSNVSILLGTGTGAFGAATNFAVAWIPLSVAIADLNGDGQPDLAVSTNNGVSILLGTGAGAFGAATDFAVGTGLGSVAIADLNGDGKPDLAATHNSGNAVLILLNTTVFDADNDGVVDAADACPGTPAGASVTPEGCTPNQAIEDVISDLEAMIAANSGTPLADKLEDALDKAEKALMELAKTPPHPKNAAGAIKNAVGDLEAAMKDGLLSAAQGNQLMLRLLSASRLLASEAIDDAIAAGGQASKIQEAQQSLAQGDALRATGAYKDTGNKYEDAISQAEGAH